MEQTREDMIRNLMDAGVSREQMERCMRFYDSGNYRETFIYLRGVRCALLEKLHDSQRRLEQLDFLLYHLKKKKESEDR